MLEESIEGGTGRGGQSPELDRHRLERLVAVGRALVSDLDLERVLQRVLETARELTGARYAALGILDDRREQLERFLTLGIDERTRTTIGDLPRGRGVLGVLISDPRPLRLADVKAHARSYGFPPGHPPMTTFLGVPIKVRGEAYGNLYLTDKEGSEFDEADERATLILAEWAGIAIDNARLYKAVSERRERLEVAVRGLQATTEIALASAAGGSGSEALSKRIPADRPPWSHVLDASEPERLRDLESRPEISSALGIRASSGLLVPLSFRGEPLGVLAAFDRTVGGPDFSDQDEELMRGFAASAATAVHTAKSVAEERLRQSIEASEQERRRWARELHDETLQALGALQVVLSSALRRGSPEKLAATVRDAVDHIGVEIRNLRALIAELRPAALDDIGLEPAIESLVERTAESTDIALQTSVDLELGVGERLPAEVESTIYRVIQEALTNVAKHARASEARIDVRRVDGRVLVRVEDDGVGFGPDSESSGFGLKGMRERVELIGGTLEVTSLPGDGTTVTAVLGRPGSARSWTVG